MLDNTRSLVIIQLINVHSWWDNEPERTLRPLQDWLIENFNGVLWVDGGEFYDRQWEAALASGTDWVVISTWNEWAENTEVEAGQRFGQFYVWRTQFWTAALKHAPR